MKEKFTATEISKQLGVSHTTVYNWVRRGLPYEIRIHGLKKIKVFEIEKVKNWIKGEGDINVQSD